MKGMVFSEELPQLQNCMELDSRVEGSRHICSAYLNTLTNKYIVFVRYKNTGIIMDVIVLDRYSEDAHLFIGSTETKALAANNSFFIAIECCYAINKPEDWNAGKGKVMTAYMFNKPTKRFKKLNPKKVQRAGEGFYYN